MSSLDRISERFSMFYDEIDTQMSRLRNSDSIFSQLSIQSDDAKLLNKLEKGEIPMTDIDDLLKSATEFDAELKTYIEKNSLRKKVAQRKTKNPSMKSKLPPIWNEPKLNQYIESIIDEVFDPVEVTTEFQHVPPCQEKNEPAAQVSTVKPILKTNNSKSSKRNVSTNVKFQIHPPKQVVSTSVASHKQQKPPKSIKKIEPFVQIQSMNTSSESLFPCRTERTTNADGSVDVTFKKSFKEPSGAKTLQPQTVPSDLKYSPVTLTSTAGNNTIAKPLCEGDVVDVIDSSLATVKTINAKQMTTLLLPVLSIKGSCSIQKIYQLEISPARDVHAIPHENEPKMNTKFVEMVFHSPAKPAADVFVVHPAAEKEAPNEIHQITSDEAENNNPSNLFDIREVNRILNDCGVHLRDGKIHFVMESARKRKGNKRTKPKKSFKPSTLRESVDELKQNHSEVGDNESREKKINICAIDEAAKQKRDEEINEKDSSMSSSITDDGKILQILKINRDGERCSRRSFRLNSSPESYPASSANNESSVQQQIPITDAERSIAENFQSIYKLIEDTFETNVGAEPTAEINENEREIDDGMNEMRAVIEMSEENIKRAGRLLEKYKAPHELTSIKTSLIRKSAASSSGEVSSFEFKPHEKSKDVKVNEEKSEATFFHQEIQTSVALELNEHNPTTFKVSLPEKSQRNVTVEACAQTSEDKIVQTDGNLNWKSQQYFGSVYEKYSNFNHINFNQPPIASARLNPFCSSIDSCNCVGCERKRKFQTNPVSTQRYSTDSGKLSSQLTSFTSTSASPKLSVPFNPIYSDDDEVMKAANRFLRSVEKRKNRNTASDITSSEVSSSIDFSPQKVHSRRSSTSTSTPSSSLLDNGMRTASSHVQRPAPRARNNLENKLQEAAKGIASMEHKVEDVERFADEEQSNDSSSSGIPQLDLQDLRDNQEFRYLSEGEVLSQGETQLGLSDDDVPDYFF